DTWPKPCSGKKCSFCIKILEQIKAMAGDDPDEEAVDTALGKVCQKLSKVRSACKRMVKKYWEKISEGLQNGEKPCTTCSTIRLCKA
ncbi:NKL protein, partial [Turnix velox]|nr:NKL protein [Turnix velox]